MTDLIKAFLLGVALIAGILTIPVVIAFLAPIITFLLIVLGIWILIKVVKDDPG